MFGLFSWVHQSRLLEAETSDCRTNDKSPAPWEDSGLSNVTSGEQPQQLVAPIGATAKAVEPRNVIYVTF